MVEQFDLIIIGAGSGNSILTDDFADWNVAIVERDVFGGTCLNRGCIPSKMFIYPASIVETVRTASPLGVDAHVDNVRWPEIVERVFGRIDPIAAGGEEYRRSLDNVTVFADDARFVGHKQVQVGDKVITADTIVLAAGARPRIPDIAGLSDVDFHTSATIMRVPQPPARLAILGGGFIACEMGHVFRAAGSHVSDHQPEPGTSSEPTITKYPSVSPRYSASGSICDVAKCQPTSTKTATKSSSSSPPVIRSLPTSYW